VPSHPNDEKPRKARECEQACPSDAFKTLSDEFQTIPNGRLKRGINVGFSHVKTPR